MMKRMKIYTLLAGALLLTLASCIRDDLDACPPLSVKIGIADKNYANIDEVERVTGLDQRLPEDESFRYYIQKLFYVLYDLDRRETVKVQHLHEVEGDAMLATAYLPENLDFGRYVLLVWGNIDSEDGIMADGSLATYDLHSDHVEGYDVYMVCDTLLYDDTHYDYTVNLKRVKGKLLIEAVNLPDHFAWSRKAVSNVYGNFDYRFQYADDEPEYVITETELASLRRGRSLSVVSDTYLAPTVAGGESTVYTRFFDEKPGEQSSPLHSLDNNITMKRNELSVLRYVYDDGSGTFEVYTLLNDSWQVVNDMELE